MGMTNKEKFKEVFGLKMDDTSDCGFFDCTDMRSCEDCPVKDTKAWWDAEYKDPTTKKDLGVDWTNYKDADGNSLDYLILNVLQNSFDCGDAYGYTVADKIIDLLPSVTPQEPRWIPVSEKLPNDRDWYLGIFKEPDTGWIIPIPFICDYVGSETKATTKEYWILRGLTDRDEHIDYYFNLECVAWMPLPNAYREVEE